MSCLNSFLEHRLIAQMCRSTDARAVVGHEVMLNGIGQPFIGSIHAMVDPHHFVLCIGCAT